MEVFFNPFMMGV